MILSHMSLFTFFNMICFILSCLIRCLSIHLGHFFRTILKPLHIFLGTGKHFLHAALFAIALLSVCHTGGSVKNSVS